MFPGQNILGTIVMASPLICFIGWIIYDYKNPKCIVCKQRKGKIYRLSVEDCVTGCGGFVHIYYHKWCLQKVEKNPQQYDDWIIFNLSSVSAKISKYNIQEAVKELKSKMLDEYGISLDENNINLVDLKTGQPIQN